MVERETTHSERNSLSDGDSDEFHAGVLDLQHEVVGLSDDDRVAVSQELDHAAHKHRGPFRQWRVRICDVVGVLGIAGWVLAFAVGVVVPSSPYQAVLGSIQQTSETVWGILAAGLVVVGCSTYTNPAFLACCAALVGSVARSLSLPSSTMQQPSHLSALFRGFFVYLVMMSGLMLLTTQAIIKATQEQYVQVAATMSIVAYLVGYDPAVFQRMINTAVGLTQKTVVERESVSASIERSEELSELLPKRPR